MDYECGESSLNAGEEVRPPSDTGDAVEGAEDDPDFESDESVVSSKGTKYWIPACPEELKPAVGMVFKSVDDAWKCYYGYGVRCRFDVRRGSSVKGRDGTLMSKCFYCNKEGFCRSTRTFDTSKGEVKGLKRKSASSRIGCKAAIVVKRHGNAGYIVSDFIEKHNHKITSDEASKFLKSRRKMKLSDKMLVLQCAKVNVGSVTAHKIAKQIAGGFDNVGPQVNEFRNWHRDVVHWIGHDDAQMVIDSLKQKKDLYKSFKFEISVFKGKLARMFWADSISQLHFHAFGDVVTFDATYGMNKYNMIFVPFTGVDNHMKSVTFAAALMCSEDAESYTWILERFIECMGRAPLVALTDQDPALSVVMPKIMPDTHHRFCIWHIMNKLSKKVGFSTPRMQEFRSNLKSIVYDYQVDTEVFEYNWQELMTEYDMADNKWLCDMYDMKELWVPAYFRDIPLGGLLRTTSRSESANSFFGGFLNCRLTLLAFFAGFETAIETQRHNQLMADHETGSKVCAIRTPLPNELHAMNTYTCRYSMMFKLQLLRHVTK